MYVLSGTEENGMGTPFGGAIWDPGGQSPTEVTSRTGHFRTAGEWSLPITLVTSNHRGGRERERERDGGEERMDEEGDGDCFSFLFTPPQNPIGLYIHVYIC